MSNKNQIGIDAGKASDLANGLNKLLSNYQLFYINARGFHWNIAGEKFFELHLKFEEIYTDALLKIDEIAERILTLGHQPLHSFPDYIKTSSIPSVTGVSDAKTAVTTVLQGFQSLLEIERGLLELSAEAKDEGTNALMSDYIRQQEKLVWMYTAFLK